MRILLDNNVDQRFGPLLVGHDVVHARTMGWAELYNGKLIAAADQAGFSAIITADKNMRYQQSLRDRTISILTLNARFVDFAGISTLAPNVLRALEALPTGAFVMLSSD